MNEGIEDIEMNQPITQLQIIGVRYHYSKPAQGDESCLNAYVHTHARTSTQRHVPFDVTEPQMPEEQRSSEEPDNIGLINGAIADVVAQARQDAGTITLSAETFIQTLVEVVASLQQHGFQRFMIVNGHGGNVAPLGHAMVRI